MHAAQGITRDAAIGVLDSGHGRLTGQAGLYVEASRARDRFVLVTDNRELLEEALEENDGARMTALEAAGEDAPRGAPEAALGMLRELRDDWDALTARAEAEHADLGRMEDYARIVAGVRALAEPSGTPTGERACASDARRRRILASSAHGGGNTARELHGLTIAGAGSGAGGYGAAATPRAPPGTSP